MNLQKLRSLHAIMETGGVTLAAEKMLLTQPAVSRSLQSLEDELGFKVFDRRNGKMILTSQGVVFYDETQRLLSAIDELPNLIREIRKHQGSKLRIRSMPEISRGILHKVVSAMASHHPDIEFSIELRQRRDIDRWASRLSFDIGFAMLPLDIHGLEVEQFASISAVAILPETHRLANNTEISVDDFVNEPMVMLTQDTMLRQVIDGMFASNAIVPKIVAETTSSDILCQLVAEGIGVGVVDAFTARMFNGGGLVARKWMSPPKINYGFVYLEDQEQTSLITDIKAITKDETRRFIDDYDFVDGVVVELES